MSSHPVYRLLAPDEVIRFRTEGVDIEDPNSYKSYENSSTLVRRCRNGYDITYVEQLMREITNSSDRAKYLADGCAAEVMLLDQTGWHRGKVKLELIFYPEAPQTQPADTHNETLDLLSS
ncbi:MAG: hypothetical protein P3X23_000590 [Thermosynechococcus sp. Uc]|uniref:hypothetical protein n=1 Tax=Thermosynechococcus sp. Uc TaxID=3034853 RepID=UPI00259DBCFF|nr:hypothetical protein [Thermosynechococcus sp. Uc]MDM7325602.1 hypothetical protein [Thermosynechococcus sp. Uc]